MVNFVAAEAIVVILAALPFGGGLIGEWMQLATAERAHHTCRRGGTAILAMHWMFGTKRTQLE